MKSLLYGIALILCVMRVDASIISINGNLTWEITEPRCTFSLDGSIQNNSPSTSGTIKLVLWATPQPFPSPGYNIGEFTLGQLSGGFQFNDFVRRTKSNIPAVSGNFYFTIAVMEFTTAGWRTQAAAQFPQQALFAGNFAAQKKWIIPNATVTAPPASFIPNNRIKLTPKATVEMNLLPAASQFLTKLEARSKTRLVVIEPTAKKPSTFIYRARTGFLNSKSVPIGRMTWNEITDGADEFKSLATISLFFQGPSAGVYKSTELFSSGREVIWGTFTFE